MSKTKKIETLAIITLITITGLTNIQTASSQNNTDPVFIEVEYFPQKRGMYCGQATTEMVLHATQGIRVRQNALTKEMNYTHEKGTKNTNMINPFQNRNATITSTGKYKTLNHLRKSVDNRQYTIINIEFAQNQNTGHYIVVTGYNQTGFFVHDPWPENWGAPEGRQTGENAYISSDLLNELWSFRQYWAMTIAGPDSIIITVEEAAIWS